jgi:hypothetical protein
MAKDSTRLPGTAANRKVGFNLDSLGVCASTLCMVHCLVFPILLAALPAWTLTSDAATVGAVEPSAASGASVGMLPVSASPAEQACCTAADSEGGNADNVGCCSSPTDFWIHVGLLATVAPLGMIAWGAGYRRHHGRGVLWLGTAGVVLLCGAILFGARLFGSSGEQMMTVSGSICMVSAHLWNRRRCRCCGSRAVVTVLEGEAAGAVTQQSDLAE